MRRIRKTRFLDQAVILCGGYGLRLGNITKKTPKPLININKKPFLHHLIENLIRYEVKNIILLCHYKHKKFNNFIKKTKFQFKKNINIKMIVEREKLDTGGAVKNCYRQLKDYFFIFNGDTFFDMNLFNMLNEYLFKNFTTLVLSSKKNIKNASKVQIKDKLIRNINYNKGNLHHSGITIMSKENLKYIKKKKFSLEKDLYKILIDKKKLNYFITKKKFLDIGDLKNLRQSNKFIKNSIFKPAVFLDRDGVINHDTGHLYKIKDFKWKKGAIDTIRYLFENNYYVFIITNQSGIGRGLYKENDVIKLHEWINLELLKENCKIDEFVFSPFYKKSKIKKYKSKKYLNMRKPNTGMIDYLIKKWPINIKKSFLIGDNLTDICAGTKRNIYSERIDSKQNLLTLTKKIHKKMN